MWRPDFSAEKVVKHRRREDPCFFLDSDILLSSALFTHKSYLLCSFTFTFRFANVMKAHDNWQIFYYSISFNGKSWNTMTQFQYLCFFFIHFHFSWSNANSSNWILTLHIRHVQLIDNHHLFQSIYIHLWTSLKDTLASLENNNSRVRLKHAHAVVTFHFECKQGFRPTGGPSDVGDLNSLVRMYRALLGSGNGLHPGLSRQRSTAAMETQTPVHWMAFWMQPRRTLERVREIRQMRSGENDEWDFRWSESNSGYITAVFYQDTPTLPGLGEKMISHISSCTSKLTSATGSGALPPLQF